jgi:hypothetical protein
MYSGRKGMLNRADFQRLLQDVNRTTLKEIQVYVDEVRVVGLVAGWLCIYTSAPLACALLPSLSSCG